MQKGRVVCITAVAFIIIAVGNVTPFKCLLIESFGGGRVSRQGFSVVALGCVDQADLMFRNSAAIASSAGMKDIHHHADCLLIQS